MTNLALFRSSVEPVLVAVTPPNDGSGLLYRFVDTFIEEKGNGRHRELYWRVATRANLVAEHEEQVDWFPPLELNIFRTPPGEPDRTFAAFRDAVEAEALDLMLAFSRMGGAQFSATTLAPILEGFAIRLFDAKGREVSRAPEVFDAVLAWVTFNFKALVQENG